MKIEKIGKSDIKDIKISQADTESQNTDVENIKSTLRDENPVKQELSATPEYNPRNFYEQEAYYDGDLYKNIDNTWKRIGGYYNGGYVFLQTTSSSTLTIDCGFKPRMIEVTAIANAPNNGQSFGVATGTGNSQYTVYNQNGTSSAISVGEIMYVENTTDKTRGSITDISDTGFTITYSVVDFDVYYIWKAFG